MESISRFVEMNGPTSVKWNGRRQRQQQQQGHFGKDFQMPLHYPRYSRAAYEEMPERKLDCLLRQYGLPVFGDVDEKRRFAIGAFVWP